jgi:hypothetical protein
VVAGEEHQGYREWWTLSASRFETRGPSMSAYLNLVERSATITGDSLDKKYLGWFDLMSWGLGEANQPVPFGSGGHPGRHLEKIHVSIRGGNASARLMQVATNGFSVNAIVAVAKQVGPNLVETMRITLDKTYLADYQVQPAPGGGLVLDTFSILIPPVPDFKITGSLADLNKAKNYFGKGGYDPGP